MAKRQQASLGRSTSEAAAYIKGLAGKSPASDIEEAKALLDAGAIIADQFAKLKARALT